MLYDLHEKQDIKTLQINIFLKKKDKTINYHVLVANLLIFFIFSAFVTDYKQYLTGNGQSYEFNHGI